MVAIARPTGTIQRAGQIGKYPIIDTISSPTRVLPCALSHVRHVRNPRKPTIESRIASAST